MGSSRTTSRPGVPAGLPIALAGLLLLSTATCRPKPPEYRAFGNPRRVTIEGYFDDAMEPFITHDGRFLLFNNRNDPAVNTDLHYARRIDDLHFEYVGPIASVNTTALEAVPSVSCDGTLYFVSTRSYSSTLSTIYRANFSDGHASQIGLVGGVSRNRPGWVNFDAEISAGGDTLYAVDSRFSSGYPAAADLFIAHRRGTAFERSPDSDRLLKFVNTSALEYAPAISADQLELFFTRVQRTATATHLNIWRSARASTTEPFAEPELVSAIQGFVEAPALSPDGRSLYYHARVNDHFAIYRVTRTAPSRNGCEPDPPAY